MQNGNWFLLRWLAFRIVTFRCTSVRRTVGRQQKKRTRMPSYSSYTTTTIVHRYSHSFEPVTIKGAIKRPAKTRGSIILESVPLIENRFSLTEAHRSTVNRLIDRFVRPINRFDRVEPCRRGVSVSRLINFSLFILPDYRCQPCFSGN